MGAFDDLPSAPAAPSDEELSKFALNDDGNAMRFIRMAGGGIGEDGDPDLTHAKALYLRHRGWIVFNGRYWDLETGEALARRLAIKVGRGLTAQMELKLAALAEKGITLSAKGEQAIRDFATQAGNNGRINSMLAVAASYMDVPIEAFDRDPMALNCLNGVVRFRREADGPAAVFTQGHVAADRFTRITAAAYDPAAAAPVYDRVVRDALPKPDVRAYVHKVGGYCSTGSTAEQKFFVFQGKGGDSKSTVVNAWRFALGSYATTAAIETFLDTGMKRGSEASPDIAALAGDSRMICAGEPPSGSKLATGQIKAFTGGGKIKARELREGLFEFTPIGKPIIECNRRPAINDTDNGIWRRLKIVPWEVQVAPDKIDGDLPRKLEAEAPGILAWLVQGTLSWMREGMKDPEAVMGALEDYRKGSNPFVQWFEDKVIREEGARTRASDFYASYKGWMEDNGHDKPMSQKAFGATLGDLQIVLGSKDGEGKVTRTGARLRTLDDPPPGSAPPPPAAEDPSGVGDPESTGGDGDVFPDSDIPWDPEDDQP